VRRWAASILAILWGGAGVLMAADWKTPAETADYRSTPRYDETIAWLRRLAAEQPRRIRMETFGKSGEGRDLHLVIASKGGLFDPEAARRAGRVVVLVQNAIHAGEMDGKDACLALLRDMVIAGSEARLLDRVVLLVMPIYNVDGHERFGRFNRINQNGPEETGWRAQARNLNLNRDYMKADTPETRAWLALWNRWLPDYFVDNHVTDGADFVYDTTYGVDLGPDVRPDQARWTREVLIPGIEAAVTRAGHVIGPYLGLKDESDPAQGAVIGQDQPRFSTGYVLLQNRPAMLVEMHMRKDYRTRVRGNTALMRALLEAINRDADRIAAMNRDADAATIQAGRSASSEAVFPLRLEADGTTEPHPLKIFAFERTRSEVSGTTRIEYGTTPTTITVPRQAGLRVARAIALPRAYLVPAQWTPVIEVLQAHGLRMPRTTAAWEGEVGTYRCDGPRWFDRPYEGRQVLFFPGEGQPQSAATLGGCRPVRERLAFPAGSVVVPLDQRAAKVAIHFLEPEGPDSAVTWGFFNAVFEQKEYAEPYVMETIARDMLAADPALRREFERRIAADPAFAASPQARLEFFYRRSPWWDARLGLYPVGRLAGLEGIPLER